ncbi:retrovirus-related Pol polyprotein from transposon TNT 1-94 [Trichonephila clavipes]|nr:retrovirus-related Pol polyprotein from transposon TNT 1-94 [Trichonephila clavipes]
MLHYEKGKKKISLEIWTGNKPKLNYLKKFGCVAYFHVPKVLRNKFEVPGRRGIMLGYARERRGYRIYDIKNQKVIEERSVKFNEYLKGSNYLGEIENETWDIDSFFEVSPERNEINQNTENGRLYNFDINNGPGAIENDNSIPLQTTSSPRTGRIQIPVLELNDVQNQIPVRRSERLKYKLMSVHLVNNVPNSYFEAENSANWKNWKLAMENELDSLDKHKVGEIVQKPAKSKLIKTKWVYSLKQDDAGKNIKYKARLVAVGFNQIKNIDYSESYSPVVNIESFRLLIALAAKLKLNVNFFDVKTAYIYGNLEETVYVLPPPGYEKLIGDDKVCKLKKSIYGLPQSGRNCPSSCSIAIVVKPFSRSSVVVERKNFLISFNLEKFLSPVSTLIGRVSNILKTIPTVGAKSRSFEPLIGILEVDTLSFGILSVDHPLYYHVAEQCDVNIRSLTYFTLLPASSSDARP